MSIAVVILNWNGERHLARFLPSVTRHTPPGVRIVVADNGSEDGSLELLARDYPQVEVIRFDRNHGFTVGYNLALALIEADCYVLLNSDVEVTPGWIEPLKAMLDSDPKVAAVSPKLLSWTERASFEYAGASGGFIDMLGYPFCRGRILSTTECDRGQYDDPRPVFWASGAAMMLRGELFHRLGGFDGKFFAHMEEIDLCWRLQLAGYRIMVEPRSTVYHLGGGSLPNNSPRKIYLNYRNNMAMLYKNLPRPHRRLTLLARMFLDMGSAAVYLLTGRFAFASAVWRAHADYCRWKPELRAQRAATPCVDAARLPTIYRRSIILRYMLGRKRFPAM
ncbi:MAG: glycosyltransferase family 2 protein [Rikenellaceae bacterium]|jgi:GT2 family glycosyltransferase|nr:glycosyltransferase family 2 protein [Rikenellaceae bacterium]